MDDTVAFAKISGKQGRQLRRLARRTGNDTLLKGVEKARVEKAKTRRNGGENSRAQEAQS